MEQRPVLSPGATGPRKLTAEEVAARLAVAERGKVRRSQDAATRGQRGDHEMNPGLFPDRALVPAAVLIPLVNHPGGLTILLTLRTAHLADHGGQISFPGGRVEASDADENAAALREANEEVGIDPATVKILGRLDTYVTRTGFRVEPVVGVVRPPLQLQADPHEVAEIFEVPLDFLIDPANRRRDSRIFEGSERFFWAIPFENRYIWGATAGMLVNLAQVLWGPAGGTSEAPAGSRP
jgi:8-oxo-dGTP pyrophosphatase MutT (NUDIX family)